VSIIPDNERELVAFANDLKEQCRVSQAMRSAYCRLMNVITETGRYDNTKSLINMMYSHLTRTASHLFSPVELRFTMDFELTYPAATYEQAGVAAKAVTRQWDRTNTDMLFGRGVFESLKYGAAILKQWVQQEGTDKHPVYYSKITMPWQFGVFNEAENDINKQHALCETTILTLPEVWRRIYWMPDAKKLFERIKVHSVKGTAVSDPQSFFHQILSSSVLQTGVNGATRPLPGGIVQLGNDPNYAVMGPVIGADVVTCHEIWVQDDTDYSTIIMIEPDVIISPVVVGKNVIRRTNLLIQNSQLQPYRLIQANEVTNWFWGRSELVDLIEPQALLSTWCDDIKRLFGLQIDKILVFIGDSGMTDERYGAFRSAGWGNFEATTKIEDLTPKMPPEAMAMLKFVIEIINTLGGFPDIMQGKGEQGVRAGNHAQTLLKTAAPSLRDRALLIERQCAQSADLTFDIMCAKDDRHYWTKANNPIEDPENTKFLLTDIPDDSRIVVDSHSSSPIFSDENTQLVFASHKSGIVGPEYVIDNTPLPNKEKAKVELAAREEAKKKQMDELKGQINADPEVAAKVAERVGVKMLSGGKR